MGRPKPPRRVLHCPFVVGTESHLAPSCQQSRNHWVQRRVLLAFLQQDQHAVPSRGSSRPPRSRSSAVRRKDSIHSSAAHYLHATWPFPGSRAEDSLDRAIALV